MEALYAYADQIKIYKAILDATAEVQKYLRYHSGKLGDNAYYQKNGGLKSDMKKEKTEVHLNFS